MNLEPFLKSPLRMTIFLVFALTVGNAPHLTTAYLLDHADIHGWKFFAMYLPMAFANLWALLWLIHKDTQRNL